MQELKSCPACGSTDVAREEFREALWIECQNCGMRGPAASDKWEWVETVWNALPRHPAGTPNDALCAGCPCHPQKENNENL